MKTFDHIIIGTGQATGTLLGQLIQTGDSIAVVEGGKVGGSCVNYGCTPTKTLVASARAIHMAGRGNQLGFSSGPVKPDYSRIRTRMNDVRNASRNGLAQWMESTDNVTLIRGWASFEDRNTIVVGDQKISGDQIYINTGTSPVKPPVDGIDTVNWMDSARLLDLEELPEHLLIIGGGYVGMEFAQIYKRFGSEVTVVQRDSQVMTKEDEEIAGEIRSFLEKEGIKIFCNANATAVEGDGKNISLQIEQDGKKETLKGTHLLIAAGMKPNSNRLNPDKAGIETDDRGFIRVDDYCRTNVEGIFALGDVNGQGAFTHTSVNDAEILMDHLFGEGQRKISDRIPIYALFTDPPLGRVGMSEKEALAEGKRIMKATMPMEKISRANEMGETTGVAKLIVDADTDLILGGAILGPGGDEIINMFAAIMHSNIPCRNYRKVVLIHPTVSELMPYVLDGLEEVKSSH